jgi:2,3-bisphosphoglycerate-independent phosphoglycerate mutase
MPAPASPLRPLVLIIRDGWGENPHREHDAFNAVKLARTPVADRLMARWPTTLIKTSGEDVGLPAGTMGNSEVGHQNIGAGRIVDQELMRITRAIRDGGFFTNAALRGAFDHARRSGGSVHLLGLLSDGKVHSDIEHLFALIDFAQRIGFPGDRVLIHAITDGRDVGPTTAIRYIEQLEAKLASANAGRIASVCGRYYAMDRDHRWDRVQRAYSLLTNPAGDPRIAAFPSAAAAVQDYYDQPTSESLRGDEFITPRLIAPVASNDRQGIRSGDAVIFFNFRGDRPREIARAFLLDDHAWTAVQGGGFDRGRKIDPLHFCAMSRYEEGLPLSSVAFEKPPKMANILGEAISRRGLAQFRCAETEKFPHVTFFFNDYREEPFDGENRLLVPSPREVTTYDQKPQMSAHEVRDGVVARLKAQDCEPLVVVNFANGDMVGHTGKLDAAIRAIEVVDECIGAIVEAAGTRGASLIITADHGNAEQMWDPINNCPHTAHTTYDVPLITVGPGLKGRALRSGGRLADIAPTALALMGLLQPPVEMTGRSLLAS